MKKTGMYYQSPIGLIWLEEDNGCVSALRFANERLENESDTPLLKECEKQLSEYFAGKRKDFDLPLAQSGTSFQEQAWEYMANIPYGKTVSYKEESVAIGKPKACRAVGSANGKNNIAIIVPCHRVIASDGSLGGYAYGIEIKKKLLALEQKYK